MKPIPFPNGVDPCDWKITRLDTMETHVVSSTFPGEAVSRLLGYEEWANSTVVYPDRCLFEIDGIVCVVEMED